MDKQTLIVFINIIVWAIITTIRMFILDFRLQKMENHVSKFFKKQAVLNVAITQAIKALDGPTYGHMEEDKAEETRS